MKREELDQEIKSLLIKCIDLEYFEKDQASTAEKIALVKADFYATQQWNVDRIGDIKALTEWLQGLPSCITIPFMNHEILQYAKQIGSLRENATERMEEKILDNWWNLCAVKLLQLFNGYRVPDLGE